MKEIGNSLSVWVGIKIPRSL